MNMERGYIYRIVAWSSLTSMLVAFALAGRRLPVLAACFCIGALISLFSLVSLSFTVQFLKPGNKSRKARRYTILIFFIKLPVYLAGLAFLVHLAQSSSFALIAGAAGLMMAPLHIILNGIGSFLVENRSSGRYRSLTFGE